MYTIKLNQQEVEATLALFDLAVKTGGLKVAEAALFLTKKIEGSKDVQEVPGISEESVSKEA